MSGIPKQLTKSYLKYDVPFFIVSFGVIIWDITSTLWSGVWCSKSDSLRF